MWRHWRHVLFAACRSWINIITGKWSSFRVFHGDIVEVENILGDCVGRRHHRSDVNHVGEETRERLRAENKGSCCEERYDRIMRCLVTCVCGCLLCSIPQSRRVKLKWMCTGLVCILVSLSMTAALHVSATTCLYRTTGAPFECRALLQNNFLKNTQKNVLFLFCTETLLRALSIVTYCCTSVLLLKFPGGVAKLALLWTQSVNADVAAVIRRGTQTKNFDGILETEKLLWTSLPLGSLLRYEWKTVHNVRVIAIILYRLHQHHDHLGAARNAWARPRFIKTPGNSSDALF